MLELVDGLTLYHGSYCKVKQPEVRYGQNTRILGKAFI